MPGFFKITAPLYYHIKKLVTFCWTDKYQKTFDQLKQLLSSAPVLAYPLFGPEHQFTAETDASVLGLGAINFYPKSSSMIIRTPLLMHQGAYKHEKNYQITTLTLVWAVKLFRPHLLAHKTVVFTDHSACTVLLKAPHPSAKIVRWAMAVQDLNLDIKHRSGKSNQCRCFI